MSMVDVAQLLLSSVADFRLPIRGVESQRSKVEGWGIPVNSKQLTVNSGRVGRTES